MVALKTLIFSILVPGTVAGVIPWLLIQGSGGTVLLFPSIWIVGFLPLLLGVGLYLWCAGAFTFIGKGTPAPIDAPKVLLVEGPYRWVRNPMYIAVLSVVIGEALLFPACRICSAGSRGDSSVCGLCRGTLSASSIWCKL